MKLIKTEELELKGELLEYKLTMSNGTTHYVNVKSRLRKKAVWAEDYEEASYYVYRDNIKDLISSRRVIDNINLSQVVSYRLTQSKVITHRYFKKTYREFFVFTRVEYSDD